MIGIKLYNVPNDMEYFIVSLKKLNIDTLFISSNVASDLDFIFTLKQMDYSIFYIFQTFYNPDYLLKHPEAYALTERGDRAIDEWVEFVCPNSDEYIDYLVDRLEDIIRSVNPTGISLDFIRQFIFWEKVHGEDSIRLVSSCRCKKCRADKRTVSEVITDVVKNLTNIGRKQNPDIIFSLHSVPWLRSEYNNGLVRLAGQDLNNLSDYVDFISPMCYSHMLKKDPNWISSVVTDHYNISGLKVIPAVQVKECYLTNKLDQTELSQIVKYSLQKPSSGVIFWSWEYINELNIVDRLAIDIRNFFIDI